MKQLAVILCIIIFCAPAALADIIMLKDGTQAEGKVKAITEEQVGIQRDTKFYYISKDNIKNIIYVKPVKEDDTMKWVIGISIVGGILLGFSLAMWGRYI
jgi:hypothetical protein